MMTNEDDSPLVARNTTPAAWPQDFDPCPDTVALAAKRAGRWARDNTRLTAAEIISLDLAIRDLAGPT